MGLVAAAGISCCLSDEGDNVRDTGNVCVGLAEGSTTLLVWSTSGCPYNLLPASHTCSAEVVDGLITVHNYSQYTATNDGTDDCPSAQAECTVENVEPGTYRLRFGGIEIDVELPNRDARGEELPDSQYACIDSHRG